MFYQTRSATWMLLVFLVAASIAALPARAVAQAFSILESPAGEGSGISGSTTEELPLPPASDSEAPPAPSYDPGPKVSPNGRASQAPSIQSQPIQSRGELVDRVVLHEAFATAAQGVVSAGPIVREAPPEVIVERPAAPPSGTNVAWIDGYWAWHPVRQTYYWISGLWREIPPGRVWVAGQWFSAPGGYQWSNGYWESATSPAPVFAKRPPNSMEAGPTSAGQAGSFWIPGEYVWQNDTYVFQPGYWTEHQERFVWQPATYIQTPSGYAHVSGYWDFELETRGVPFAPLSVPVEMARQMRLSVSPSVLLAPEATLCLHMFTQPGDSHYYFGSYYGATDVNRGMLPWHDPRSVEYSGSPLLSYYEWKLARSGVPFSSTMATFQSRYRSQAATRPAVRAVSINGQAYAATDPLSSGASSLKQLLSGGGQVANSQIARASASAAAAMAASQAAGQRSRLAPQPDRSLQGGQFSRQQTIVAPLGIYGPGLSLSITGSTALRPSIPRVGAPALRLGLPAVAVPPNLVPSPFGIPSRLAPRTMPRLGVPTPGLPPLGPPSLRRGFRR
ncbi:MAG: hypothetical protein Aurels2KO_44260 [Aureliella sp.]